MCFKKEYLWKKYEMNNQKNIETNYWFLAGMIKVFLSSEYLELQKCKNSTFDKLKKMMRSVNSDRI